MHQILAQPAVNNNAELHTMFHACWLTDRLCVVQCELLVGVSMSSRVWRGSMRKILATWTALVAAAILGLGATGLESAVAAAPNPPSPFEQAKILDAPSVVLIKYDLSGFITYNKTGDKYGGLDQSGNSTGNPLSVSFIGTGFFVSGDGYIVTAAHLAAPTPDAVAQALISQFLREDAASSSPIVSSTNPDADAASLVSDFTISGTNSKITVFTQDMNLASHPAGISASLSQSSPANQNDTAVIKVDGQNFPVLQMGDSSAAQVGDQIAVIGYPATSNENVDLGTMTSPTITQGTITNKNQQNGFDRLQSDATAEHGNSGGPMVGTDGKVLGIVSNGPTSTTNFFIPANTVNNVMKQAGVSNKPGQIDQLWQQGLAEYGGQHYKHAQQLFSQCTALNAAQVGCKQYNTKATANFSQDVPDPSDSNSLMWVLVAAAVLVLLLLGGGLLIFVLVRSRKKQAPPAGTVGTPVPVDTGQASAGQPLGASDTGASPAAAAPQAAAAPPAAADGGPAPSGSRRFCGDCGAEAGDEAFCKHCGHRL